MRILAIDTSGRLASCSLYEDGREVASCTRDSQMDHSRTILPLCEEMVRAQGLTFKDIDAYAAAVGPGSFTGIRIGVALAKGMAFPKGIPTVGVLSTEALAWPYRSYPGEVAAVLDARRNRVFCGIYQNGKPKGDIEVIDVEELPKKLTMQNTAPMLVGDGALMCYNQLIERYPMALAPTMLREIRASAVAEIGEREFLAGRAVKAADLRPVYVQMSQAERTLKEKNQK